MSNTTNRDTATRDGGSVEQRLARLLDSPFLTRVVPHLPPETLHQLVLARGLDVCGELVTAATPAQLTAVLDLDLWRGARPGHDEQFDAERFGEWIEALVEFGSPAAARTVAALDKDLVIAGLSRYVRVFDPGIFEPVAQSDDEPGDRADAMREGDAIDGEVSGGGFECEVAGYMLRARKADTWDAIVTLLVALDADHNRFFHAVMRGCRDLSNSRPEVDGLDELLLDREQQLHEVAIEREHRRSQQGYATPADARAFLEMARHPKKRASGASPAAITTNPLAVAYFRAADEVQESSPSMVGSGFSRTEASPAGDANDAGADTAPESIDAVMELLTEAGVMPARPRALLEAGVVDPQAARLTRLRRLMAHVRDQDEDAYLTRSRELAFLANTLVAGCSVQSRPFTTQEAADAAAAVCNLGFEFWPARWPAATALEANPPDAWLVDHDLVSAFEVGWLVLYQDVSLFAAKELISTLKDLQSDDRELRRELVALRRTLVKEGEAGTPWRARGAAEILSMLDPTAWVSVIGLLDECPVLPAALTAVLEGRKTTVSPTAFDFISTATQIGHVRDFMRKLPGLLSR